MVTLDQFLDDPLAAAGALASQASQLGSQAGLSAAASVGVKLPAIGSVGADGKVTGPAAQVFGSDPQTFILNATRRFRGDVSTLINRVAARAGSANFSTSSRGKQVSISSRAKSGDSNAKLALLLALHARHHPAQLADEAGRMAAGVGPGRGLDGCVDWPSYMVASGQQARGLFGVDDAVLFAAVVSIVVAIIGVAGPFVIQGLVAVVGSVAPEAGKAVEGFFGKKEQEPVDETIFGLDPVIVMVAAAAVAAYFLFFAKKRATA